MPDTQISKYNFENIEKRLDAIKFDQGESKFLRGDGTYAEPLASEVQPYDDTNIKNQISQLENSIRDKATESFVTEKINEAKLSGGGSVNLDDYQTKEQIGELSELSTSDKTVVGAINELKASVDSKINSGTTLSDYGITDAYSKEEIDERLTSLPSSPAETVTYEDERLVVQDDIKNQSETLTFTIDETGKCTAPKDLANTFTSDKAHLLFGDVYKLDFKVKRALYWMALERNPDSDDLLVLGVGKGYTGKLATLSLRASRIIDTIQSEDSSKNKSFPADTRIRVYRDLNGVVTLYYKQPSDATWIKWFDVQPRNIYTEKVLGFVTGIAGNEFSDNFTGEKDVVFEDMKIQRTEPFPFARNFDIRLANLELANTATT